MASWVIKDTIKTSPEQVINAYRMNGYSINNVRLTYGEHPGPMFIPDYGVRFDLLSDGKTYNLFVVQYDRWEKAHRSAYHINSLDRRMNGGYAYAFYYGKVLVQICPSNVELGHELQRVLKKIEW